MSEQLQTRALTIVDVDVDGDHRTIEAVVAPYDEIAEFGGYQERYAPGVFGDLSESRIPLKLETARGHSGPVVGRAVSFAETETGLVGTFEIAETRDGDDALTLARMDALGLSAGFLISDDGVTRSEGVTTINRASLREVTMTGTPAYQGAELVEVRSQEVDTMETETTETPDVSEMISAAVQDAVDQTRSALALEATETLETVEAEHRGHEYRSVGEVLVDMNLHARNKSADASERLTRSIDDGLVSADGSELVIRDSFGPPVPNSVGNSVPNNVYIPDLLTLLREGRPCADLFTSRDLPAEGNTIQLPSITVGNTVDYQDGEGVEVERTDQVQVLSDYLKATIAGGQPMSIQSRLWSSPSYFEAVVSDLAAAYSEFLDGQTIIGDPAVDTPTSGTGYSGILDAGATDVPVGGDHLAAVALVGTAWAAVYAGSRRSPIAAIMNSVDWGAFLDLVDADGRPVVTTEAPSNPAGFGDASSISGTLRSIPVVLDDNTPAGNVILGSFRDAILFEDSPTPATIALDFPSTLVTDVTVYGFSSLAIRRPAAFAVLSGIV